MLLSTQGIILRTVNYGETSIICDIYTEQVGLCSYVINGVRKARARIPGSIIQPLNIVEIVAYNKTSKNLNRIKEAKLKVVYRDIPIQLTKGFIGQYLVELIRKSIKERETNFELYHFLSSFLVQFDDMKEGYFNAHLWFTVHLAHYLGFPPQGTYSASTPHFNIEVGSFTFYDSPYNLPERSGEILSNLSAKALDEVADVCRNGSERKIFIDHILKFYQYHIDSFDGLNSHKILSSLF